MCQFKFCAGAHSCFLKDVSPCPAAAPEPKLENEAIEFGKQAELLGLRGKGFLDRDQLIVALGLDDHTPKEQETAKIIRITSKLRDAVANVSTRLAS